MSLSNLLQFRYDENLTCLHSQTKDDIEDMLNRNDLKTMLYTYVISHLTDKVLAEAIFDDDRDYSKETWQKTSGYNLLYDAVFHIATNGNMKNDLITFEAEENDENGNEVKNEYVLWLWHGDYLNLGSGCEIGLYTNPHALKDMKKSDGEALIEQWDAIDFELPMTLYLYNKCVENIDRISKWEPNTPQWWITSFNPDYEANADEQIMIGTVDYSMYPDLYSGLKKAYNSDKFQNERTENDATLIFEDNTVWIFWCEGSIK